MRLHQSLARKLGSEILSGKYLPGESFEPERDQSLALGVSRTPYREAIQILVSKGLIESRPKTGTRVNPRQRWNLLDPDILAWMFMGEPDPAFINQLFELRGIIEPAAAALAAERRSTAHLEAMSQALAGMKSCGLATDEGQAADREFHRLVLEATGNETLVSLAGSVGAAVQWTTHFKRRGGRTARDPLPEHLALYDAIADGDAGRARGAMEHLVSLALEDMQRAM